MLTSDERATQKRVDMKAKIEGSVLPLIGGSCRVDIMEARGHLRCLVIRVIVRKPIEGDMATALVAVSAS